MKSLKRLTARKFYRTLVISILGCISGTFIFPGPAQSAKPGPGPVSKTRARPGDRNP